MANHVVVIVDDEYGCSVAPTSLLANWNDEIFFLNLTGGTVHIHFPQGHPFQSEVGDVGPGEPGKTSRTVQNSAEFRSYPFQAKCITKDQYAQASIPRIIIHPVMW